jgi:hypothetical protein
LKKKKIEESIKKRKKKEEKELGVGTVIKGCLLTKPSWQAPTVRLLFLT